MKMHNRKARHIVDLALSGDEAARAAAAQSPQLRTELSALRSMVRLLRESVSTRRSDPFLAERVIRRLGSPAHREQLLYRSLLNVFRPVMATALLLFALFMTHNVAFRSSDASSPTTAEVVLGLEPVTLTEAFAADLDDIVPIVP